MNNNKLNNIFLSNPKIAKYDEYRMLQFLIADKFTTVGEVLDLRVFDLMNMNGISSVIAEEIMYILYKALNNNDAVDRAMYEGAMHQPFDFGTFRKKCKKQNSITVRDIVLAPAMNEAALDHLYKITARAFYKSSEYNCRKFRYRDKQDYLRSLLKETEAAE